QGQPFLVNGFTIKAGMLPFDTAFRFANKYAYFTFGDGETIDKKRLPLPKDVFPKELTGLVSISLRIEHIPENIRGALLEKLGDLTGNVAKQNEKETKTQQEFREI